MHYDVVILGSLQDPHVSSVIRHLHADGIRTICIDQIDLWQDTVTFRPERPHLRVGDKCISSTSLVWNRRAYPTLIEFMSKGDKKFARDEFSHSLFGSLRALSQTWFNSPESIRHASYKVAQLSWASRDGRLRMPRSIITSNEADAKAFLDSASAQCVIKPLYMPIIEGESGFERMYTSCVDSKIVDNIADIKNSPCILQDFIERRCDVRLNIIGSDTFATRMETRHIAKATYDGRNVDDYHNILHTPIDPPDDIVDACIDMCAHFGLRFAAFDFAMDNQNQWFFLEINPNGQWYWIEEMTGQPLSQAMAGEIRRQLRLSALPASRSEPGPP